ncbi:hypothetical protein ACHWQZ_G017962 [Mnemiopsis leidyi]
MNPYNPGNACSLWMGDLEPQMDEAYLTQLYEGLGYKVVSVRLIKDRMTGRPQGYCFLEFETEQIAQQVLMTLNLKPWPGTDKLLKLNWASSSSRGSREEFSIYVGDLSPEVNDNTLFKFFATSLSSCKSAKVVTEQNGVSKGFGFVRFSSDEDAKKAISSFNLMSGLGKNRIRVCKAFPKQGDRAQNNMNQGGGPPHQGAPFQGGDPWNQYQQQMSMYNQNMAQYQQQYNEATDIEPYDDGSTVDSLNKEIMDNDKEFSDLFELTRWQYVDSVLALKPMEQVL